MTKQTFNNIEVLEQIQYINDNIGSMSLTKYCDTLGINRGTISKRFKKLNYIFDKKLNQFTYTTGVEESRNNTESLESNIRPLNNDIDINTLLKEFHKLQSRVTELENKVNTIEVHKNNTNVLQDTESNIQFYDKNNDTVKTFRIDIDVFNRFKEYCNKNSQYKQKDIISTALEQYLNKYDK